MKKIAILGSTGSIGVNTLNVIRANEGRFQVVALAAGKNIELLHMQIEEFNPAIVAVENEILAEKLKGMFSSSSAPTIFYGTHGYEMVATAGEAELVFSALSGSVGLLPTVAAIGAGKVIALANKEVMVMAGDLVCKLTKERGSTILPVDSEHSAIFQCLLGHRREDVTRIILTASGGPFWQLPPSEFVNITIAQAFNHPRWNMGKKITIDSATLMNKGLEVIEAHWLFDIDFDAIHIHIHPQSIVHSLVEYIDGTVIGQLSVPNMKIPIAYVLSYPERIPVEGARLNLLKEGILQFFPPDLQKFPSIELAYEAGRGGGTMPAVLNAANEIAVQSFIQGDIRFIDITTIIDQTLSQHCNKYDHSLDDILAADAWARNMAQEFVNKMH